MRTLVIVAVVGLVLYVGVLRPRGAVGATPISPPPLVPATAGNQQLSSGDTFALVMAGINDAFNTVGKFAGANPAQTSTGGVGFTPPPPPSFTNNEGSQGGIFGSEYDYNA